MSERFLYDNGLEISLSDAYTFIQGIANNRIRNLTKIITQSPGFLNESFETVALEKDASTASTYYLKLKVGPVVFPNGEIFNGQEFICRVAINKSSAAQYLKVVHMVMRRTKQDQAFGEENYAEEMDGVRLTLTETPDLTDDGSEMLVMSVKYLPDMHIPETEDLRDPWIFFWSASTIINTLEEISVDNVNIHSSKSLWSNDINILNSSDFNNECSTIISIPQEVDSARHAWDILVKSAVPEISTSTRDMEPYPVSSGKPNVITRLPQGLEANLLLRKNDAYRDVSTEWGESGSFVVSHDEGEGVTIETPIPTLTHDSQPLLGLKFYSLDDISTGFFLKLWLSDTDSINTDKPPHYILPIPSSVASHEEIPYVLFPYAQDAAKIYFDYQVISPGHTIIDSANDSIGLSSNDSDADVIELAFRADRRDQLTRVLTGISYLTGDINAESAHAVWAGVANGSFRISIDGVVYNIDAINFGAVASMADVASTLQAAIRAATGALETVVWLTDHFIITTVKSALSAITVTSTSTGTVGTDISGAGAANWMDADIDEGVVTNMSLDPYGRKLFYNTAIARFYLPITQAVPDEGMPQRQLTKLEFENYSPYTAWPVVGVGFEAPDTRLGPFAEEPPIDVGDQVVVTNTSNAAVLPNGTYLSTAKYVWGTGGQWYVKIHHTGGPMGTGTCNADSNPASTVPKATIEIQPASGELNTYTYGGFTLEQAYVANFPGVCYSDTESVDSEFSEGRWYEIRLTHVSGGSSKYMQAVGNLRLHFKKA